MNVRHEKNVLAFYYGVIFMRKIQKRVVALIAAICMVHAVSLFSNGEDASAASAGSADEKGVHVNVTDSPYGANGSDKKDDTKAIQKALDLRKNGKDKTILTVEIPAGTYYINKQLHIYSNTTLKLDKDAVIVRSDDTKRMLIGGFTNSTIGGYNQLENVTITGGTWDGNNKDSTHAVNLMYLWHGKNITFSNTTIKEVCGSHFVELAAVSNARFENVTFRDFVYYTGEGYRYIYNLSAGDDDGSMKEPIVKRVSIRSEAIQLEYPGPFNSKTALPYDNTPCRDITVTGCKFLNCLSGVGNHHPEVSSPNITITNNTFNNMGASCVNLSNMTGVTVSGNTATKVRAFLYSTGGTSADITKNTISYGFDSIEPRIEQDTFYMINSNIRMTDNQIYGCGKRAVFDAGGSTVTMKNNTIDLSTIRASGRNAVQMGAKSGSTITIDNNTIKNSDMSGIWISGSSGSVTNNTISVSLSEGGSGIRVINNSKLSITGNQISNVAASGIRLLNNQTNTVTVSNNTITKPGTQGLSIENSSVTASGNTLSSSGSNGIKAISGSKLTAKENTITSPASSGISLIDSSLTASGNKITKPNAHGIGAENSSVTASDNTITSPAGNGMFLTGISGSITKNTISGAKRQGVAIVGSKSLTVSGNKITDVTRNGIYVDTSTVTLSDNTISKTTQNGIRIVISSKATVTGNKISGAKAQGLGVENSTVAASKNVISGSSANGIYLDGAAFTVTENTIRNSGTNSIHIADDVGPSSGSVTENVLGTQQISNRSKGKVTVENNCPFVETPVLSSVENVEKGVKVTWNGVTGAVRYRVFYKTGSGGWKQAGDTTATSYIWTGAKSGTAYTFTVRCTNHAGTLYASDYDRVGKSITFIEAPKLLCAENVSNGIRISWDAVTGVERYRVYYRIGSGGWTQLADTASTSYIWTGAKKGTTYTFTVRCMSSDGKRLISGFDSTGRSNTCTDCCQFATPKITAVSNEADGVKITWGKVTGAVKYRVYYKIGSGNWTKLADTTDTSYTWTGAKSGTKYTFTVRCISFDSKSSTSGFDSTGKSITYVAAPKLSGVENVNGGVKITWGKVTGAEKYRVYYRMDSGNWNRLADTTSTSYIWTGAKSGTRYTFTVRCISADGKSTVSGYDHTGKSITYVAAPKLTSVESVDDGIKISWDAVTGAGKYRVYYKTGSGGWKMLADTDSVSYTWTEAKKGNTYTFTVRCMSSDGKSLTSGFDDIGKTIQY